MIKQEMKNNIEIYKAGAAYGELVGQKLTAESLIATIKKWDGVNTRSIVELLESIVKSTQEELNEYD